MQGNTETDDATDEPLAVHADERQAIRDELPADIHIVTYYGSEPMVALVNRDRAPSVGDPSAGETVVLVEWHENDDYALSVAEGARTGTTAGWELTDELVSVHDTRADAVEAAADLFGEVSDE
jgi:hypothetical protein